MRAPGAAGVRRLGCYGQMGNVTDTRQRLAPKTIGAYRRQVFELL